MPKHGNLQSWANQGVLLINTSLTVQHGYPNGHAENWTWMTDIIIKYISDKTNHVVFVLWGSPAYSKRNLIDTSKHLIVASSHPSGLSYNNKMQDRPAFKNQDHFKLINTRRTQLYGMFDYDMSKILNDQQ
jgi:uracil-DNA glycosylase